MTVKTIITEPNKLLRQVSKPVDQVGKEQGLGANDRFITYQEVFKTYLSKIPQAMARIEAAMAPFAPMRETDPLAFEAELNRFIFEGDENQPPLFKVALKLR